MKVKNSTRQRWAQFRFTVVGPLLSRPPAEGQLQEELQQLSQKAWRHPQSGEEVRFGFSTLERWYYKALRTADPLQALERKARRDQGQQPGWTAALRQSLCEQYRQSPEWSAQLHRDNLEVRVRENPALGPLPSYATVRRFLRRQGLPRQRARRWHPETHRVAHTDREVRSYEVEFVGGLWHLDFHHGSLKVVNARGQWHKPILLAVLDDYSRLACHVQWYRSETTADLIHGLSQAILKRGLPRALLSDNGSAMLAEETRQGLLRLGIMQETTLPRSPYQNGKQEVFFSQVEGRLMAMLKGTADLTLRRLNEATCAWVEMEYQRRPHAGIDTSPLQRFLQGKQVLRPAPEIDPLRLAFTRQEQRTQRHSDGTVLVSRIRFEVPAPFRHLTQLTLRYASWDLSRIWLIDPVTQALWAPLLPCDKHRNADGFRRPTASPPNTSPESPSDHPLPQAPLLRHLLAEFAATGLPPNYFPQEED